MIYRHGDLILQQRTQLPQKQQLISHTKTCVLAEGEVSGHKHILTSDAPILFLQRDRNHRFIELETYGSLTHEEHNPIALPPGIYEITREREYDYVNKPQAVKVLD